MAAIDLTRLDQQIDHLASLYRDAVAFKEEFHRILSFYHRYSHRKQKDAVPKSFMRHYDLPEKVLAHLEARLKALPASHPDETLKIIDQLWGDDYFEARELAASLAGNLPICYSSSVLELFNQWLQQPLDQAVYDVIIRNTSRTLQQEAPGQWQDLVNRLLFSTRAQSQKMGLLALAKLIPGSSMDDLPTYFSWTRGFLLRADTALDKYLQPVVEALAQRSQQETAYLLREVLADSNDARVGRRVRHFLEFFEEPSKTRILNAIKNQVILPGKNELM
ncbi:MAG: DNA alkylation repair protein [Anaerolineaceae bacterium]|nr:DNA alkylation repair protein [Anaerolineaceae bacterium]MDD4043186.1 DNA alkylation repair protein [Anaerolineaceae bacterium]MDD4578414.1 DNA alkylation repair protein [Anaerolineaceae bacterium]